MDNKFAWIQVDNDDFIAFACRVFSICI